MQQPQQKARLLPDQHAIPNVIRTEITVEMLSGNSTRVKATMRAAASKNEQALHSHEQVAYNSYISDLKPKLFKLLGGSLGERASLFPTGQASEKVYKQDVA